MGESAKLKLKKTPKQRLRWVRTGPPTGEQTTQNKADERSKTTRNQKRRPTEDNRNKTSPMPARTALYSQVPEA